MKNKHLPNCIAFIFLTLCSFHLSAQKTSSIYLDSRAVADYINEVQEPFIDASQLPDSSFYSKVISVFPPGSKEALEFPENRRIPLKIDGQEYKLVLKLNPSDTVFVNGNRRLFITSETPDTVRLFVNFTTHPEQYYFYDSENGAHILSPEGRRLVGYGPANGGPALKAVSKLAAHVYYQGSERQFENLPLEQLKSIYSANPFTAKKIMKQKSISNLSWTTIDAIPMEDTKYFSLPGVISEEYPWQAVLDGDSTLNFEQQVSFETQNSSYRDQILTSEKALSLASQQINQTGRQAGLLDARAVAVGMSDFIAERAQEELNLTFFERFKTNMLDTNELTVLFPKTRDLLVDFEISNYKTLLSHARTSFETDLGNIGLNFPKILSLPKYEALQNDPNVFNLALIYSLSDLAYKERPVEDIVLYACQTLDNRKKELEKSISVRVMDNLLAGHDHIKPNMEIDSLEVLRNKSEHVVKRYQEAQSIIGEAYDELYFMGSRYGFEVNSAAGDNRRGDYWELTSHPDIWIAFSEKSREGIFVNAERIDGEKKKVEFQNLYGYQLNSYLSGKKYYVDLLHDSELSEETFEQVFLNGQDIPEENYIKGLSYVRDLKNEKIATKLRQRHDELNRYMAGAKEIEKEYFTALQTDYSLLDNYISSLEKFELLASAFWTETNFWSTLEQNHEHHSKGLSYLSQLFGKKFQVFYYNIYRQELKELEGQEKEDFFNNNLAGLFKEYFKEDFNSSFDNLEKELIKHKILLEEQIERLFQAHGRGSKIVNQRLLNLRDTFRMEKAKIDKILSKANFQYRSKEKIISDIKNANGYTKLYNKYNTEGNVKESDLERLLDEAEVQAKGDTTYQRLDALTAESFKEYEHAKELFLQKKEQIIKELYIGSNDEISETLSFSFSDPEYNIYLHNFEKSLESKPITVLDEITEQHFKNLDSLTALIEPAIARMEEAQIQLGASLDSLEVKYAPDLIKAKRNAANLRTSMEMSMHLLSAFRNPAEPLDSMFIMDTTVVEVSIANEYGITRTYDSLMVKEKYISDKNLKLPGSRWMTADEFSELKNDPLQWNIFLGMLYERLRRVEGSPNISATGVALLTTKFFDILHEMDEHRNKVRFKKAMRKEIGFKDYYPFIKSTVDLFNTVINTPTVGTDTLAIASQFKEIQKVSEISDEALSMYENIYVKNYGNSIRNAMALLSIFTHSEYDPENPIYNKVLRAELGKELSEKEFKKTLKKQKVKIRKSRRAINAVLTYGTFMSDMINAQTSDQVKNILKSATLPPGSSRIKREVSTSFTVNSYLGGAVAYDQIQEDLPGLEQGAIGASMSVPIGFTYSFSPDRIFKRGGSFSFHVPIFDLGAITAFRSNPSNENYQIEQLPEFGWKNLFAPGAFFVWNIRNSPFSMGAGGQIGPQLREITDLNTSVTTSVNSTRFPMVFFSVDVPFFNLHTGAKKIVVD